METFDRETRLESRLFAGRWRICCLAMLAGSVSLLLLLHRFSPNRPTDFRDPQAHFFYGSIGSDLSGGLPLKVIQVLPSIFSDYLPTGSETTDYTAFGFLKPDPHSPMPIGFSKRRRFIDFTAINCAACHTGVVRETVSSKPRLIAAMPANTVNLLGFFEFLFRCARDKRFTSETILAEMSAQGMLQWGDRLIYRFVIPQLREALLERETKLAFLQDDYPPFGPGRVNTFDTFKFDQFADFYSRHQQPIPQHELYGTVDFPSVWNQRPREGMQLHWDGNNSSVRERNFSAALGAGAAPHDMDIPRLFRVEAWLRDLPPPKYPFPIDNEMAQRGQRIYRQLCFDCHDMQGSRVGSVVPLADIGTDRGRVDSYTSFLKRAQQDYTAGYSWSFKEFTKTDGYANHPLDGVWARAPYLHNGAVPNMWALLTPEDRPVAFTIGHDVYDQRQMGFRHIPLSPEADRFVRLDGTPYEAAVAAFVLDTRLTGNGNAGHTGPEYGTQLSPEEKRALIEYLKSL